MRIIRFLLISLITVGILGGTAFLITREVLLFMGISRLKSSLTQLRQISTNSGPYVQECQRKGLVDLSQAPIDKIQLTFTSNTEFEVTVVCNQFLLDPVIISRSELPPLVTKKPGTSGFIWGDQLMSVTLQLWGREESLVLENMDIKQIRGSVNTPLGTGPVAACQGYGFSCCSVDSTEGQGDQISTVSDCPRSCFAGCKSRPVILSFTSEPFFDSQSRQLTIQSGETVSFHFVIDKGQAVGAVTTLDFGDGQQQIFDTATQAVDHTYTCSTGSCNYVVKLRVVDSNGVSAANTTVSQIAVTVE